MKILPSWAPSCVGRSWVLCIAVASLLYTKECVVCVLCMMGYLHQTLLEKKSTCSGRWRALLFTLFLFLGGGGLLHAQNEPLLSQWQSLPSYYSPAAVGSEDLLRITALYHQQWIGIQGAPANMALVAGMPFAMGRFSHGVGVAFVGQKKGLYLTIDAKAQYAFGMKLLGGKLSVGVEVGLTNSSFDGTKVFIPDGEGLNPNDPAIPTTQVSGRGFDLGAGLYFSHPRFYVGFGAKHLLAPKIPLGTSHIYQLDRTYNALAGYNFTPSNSLLSYHPSVLAVTDFRAFRVDIGFAVGIAKSYFVGVMYRPNNAAGFQAKAIWGAVSVGYAFEMPITELARGNYGTHELVVSYAMPVSKPKTKGLMKKSIRLL